MRYLRLGAFGLLGLAVLYQANLVYRNYAVEWVKATYRTLGLSSMHRSARFFLGESWAEYVSFLRSVVPTDMPVVKPEDVGFYGDQSVLQFFLLPRGIPACPCEFSYGEYSDECAACLARPSHYVPSVGTFHPDAPLGGKKRFVEFPGRSELIHGVYVPLTSESGEPQAFEPVTVVPFLRSAALAALALTAVTASGYALARASLGEADSMLMLAAAFPLGSGLVTLGVFLSSWLLALPVTVASYIAALALIIAGLVIASRPLSGRLRVQAGPIRTWRSIRPPWLGLGWTEAVITAGIILVLVVSTLISLGRAYSTFDGIANWALKGYAIAEERSVLAGARWGGHALEYPQNLHLQIAFFKLLDDDYLPGSKLLFPAYLGSLALACVAYWRTADIDRRLHSLGGLAVVTVPLVFVHSTQGFANLPMSAYLVLGILLSLEGVRTGASGQQQLGSLLLGLAAWTRLEAAVYALAAAATIFGAARLFRLGRPRLQLLLGPMLVVMLPWIAFYIGQGSQSGEAFDTAQTVTSVKAMVGEAAFENADRLIQHMQVELRDVSRWGAVVGLSAIGITIGSVRAIRHRDSRFGSITTVSVVLLFTILAVFYVIGASNRYDFVTWLDLSFDRHLIPVFVLMLVLSVYGLGRGTMQHRSGASSRFEPQ